MLRLWRITLTNTHTQSHSIGLLWTRDRPVTELCSWKYVTHSRDRKPCPLRDSNSRSQQASGRKPTPWNVRPPRFDQPIFNRSDTLNTKTEQPSWFVQLNLQNSFSKDIFAISRTSEKMKLIRLSVLQTFLVYNPFSLSPGAAAVSLWIISV